MDKQKLKTFAIESRRKLIEDVTYQANLLGVNSSEDNTGPFETADGMQAFDIGAGKPYKIYDEDIKKRESLITEVDDKGFDNVMEEVAYTWFNRIIAIRYMELHNYLPTHVRVLSSEVEGKNEPDIITESPNIDLDFTQEDEELIYKLKDENNLDELFQFLFIKQCNKLNEILPGLFEKTEDYMELLLNLSYTSEEGIIKHLINDISVEDFVHEEIIGWFYQYYNAELKDITFKNLKKNKEIPKKFIPAATQLFTPDWIVKYMVENSLGRLWLEGHPDKNLENEWKYYLKEVEQDPEVESQLKILNQNYENLKPEDIKILDPCMGSGHILIYAFDVLMQIYLSCGYSKQDASIKILKNNLYGLDIDDRAYQLAYFVLMMKARSFNKKILNLNFNPLVFSIQETNNIPSELINFVVSKSPEIKDDLEYLINIFRDAKELGSTLNLKKIDIKKLQIRINNIQKQKYVGLNEINLQKLLKDLIPILNQYIILINKYDIVVTNPPYMNSKGMPKKLKLYLKNNYPNSKSDLCTVFIEKCFDLTKESKFSALITQQSFMFLHSFKDLRDKFLSFNLINMVHFGAHAFEDIGGEVVQTTSFILRKTNLNNYNSTFLRLTDFNSQKSKQQQFFNEKNYFKTSINSLNEIPESILAYWASNNIINSFNIGHNLGETADVKKGLATADNNRFLRFWFEVNYFGIDFNCYSINKVKYSQFKWFPLNKGGSFRKWYGNQEYVINWENDGYELKNFKKSCLSNQNFYFKPSLSWSVISSNISFRKFPSGFIFDHASGSVFLDEDNNYILGFLNSIISHDLLKLISPTLNYEVGHISSLPIIFNENYKVNINQLVNQNINICKNDWNDYEVSWNFMRHPLLNFNQNLISTSFKEWENYKNNQFAILKSNEIKLNEIFSDIYSINHDDIVDDKQISVTKANYLNDIKSFISYAVGCMFGRYSLDDDGLICTNNDLNLNDYSSFLPDVDNIVPITDREYFDDDIVGRFVEFVHVSFGSENLEENLDFIAGALKKSGGSSREVIRNYFLKDFFENHKKMYKKCPIYWLFDSGKENGFKCLVYMHRYTPDLVARVRTDYLHKTQKAIESQIDYQESIKEHSSNSKDKSRADKQVKLLTKQLNETKVYDEALAHVASQSIKLDLDDGVKVNYAKFQGVEVSHEGQKTCKINLLKKL